MRYRRIIDEPSMNHWYIVDALTMHYRCIIDGSSIRLPNCRAARLLSTFPSDREQQSLRYPGNCLMGHNVRQLTRMQPQAKIASCGSILNAHHHARMARRAQHFQCSLRRENCLALRPIQWSLKFGCRARHGAKQSMGKRERVNNRLDNC